MRDPGSKACDTDHDSRDRNQPSGAKDALEETSLKRNGFLKQSKHLAQFVRNFSEGQPLFNRLDQNGHEVVATFGYFA